MPFYKKESDVESKEGTGEILDNNQDQSNHSGSIDAAQESLSDMQKQSGKIQVPPLKKICSGLKKLLFLFYMINE